jgi:hypothetical protein
MVIVFNGWQHAAIVKELFMTEEQAVSKEDKAMTEDRALAIHQLSRLIDKFKSLEKEHDEILKTALMTKVNDKD